MPRSPRWLVALAAGAAVLSAGPAVASAAPPAVVNPTPFSTIVVDRSTVAHGESFTVAASRYWPNEEVYVRLIPEGRADETRALGGFDGDGDPRAGRRIVTLAILLANGDGEVSGTVRVPGRHGRYHHLRGEYRLELAGHGSQLWQSIPFRVVAAEFGEHHRPGHVPADKPGREPGREYGQGPDGDPGTKPREDAPLDMPAEAPETAREDAPEKTPGD
ncbi:hypothetical protein DEJ51_31490 [Streptomyces venezuelae]|uniref:Secreted protein n=1 Tax=Streptomyces venezuelae TaxID=54571 RepID=A0A5P2DTB7_STRVZ|nr:hypothetical protein [Streptomyces venezuelae]QES58113.1 hypothetical protein DEJ51_31490 [Streptomyces venezuelae]